MKFTSYKQIKEATEKELKQIDPEDYTDEEFIQIQEWLTQASLELIPEERLLGLDETDKMILGLKSNDIITESKENIVVKDYPNFSIVQKIGTNDFYRIMHSDSAVSCRCV